MPRYNRIVQSLGTGEFIGTEAVAGDLQVEHMPSFGCHQHEAHKMPLPPESWRRIFDECYRCRRGRTKSVAPGIVFFICIPCHQAFAHEWEAAS